MRAASTKDIFIPFNSVSSAFQTDRHVFNQKRAGYEKSNFSLKNLMLYHDGNTTQNDSHFEKGPPIKYFFNLSVSSFSYLDQLHNRIKKIWLLMVEVIYTYDTIFMLQVN